MLKTLAAGRESLSCLDPNTGEIDKILCNVVWKDIEGETCTVHEQTKDGIKFVLARAVKRISYYIHEIWLRQRKPEIKNLFYSKNSLKTKNLLVMRSRTLIYCWTCKDGTPVIHNPFQDINWVQTHTITKIRSNYTYNRSANINIHNNSYQLHNLNDWNSAYSRNSFSNSNQSNENTYWSSKFGGTFNK